MTVVLLVLLLLLVLVNGFFVAAEFAIVRSRQTRIDQMAAEGVRSAKLAATQMDHVDEFVATCQVGITLASLGIGFLGEPAIAELLVPVFGGVMGHGLAIAISIAIAYMIVTYLHVIIGEQSPKLLAIARPETVMLRVARPLKFFRTVFHPLIVSANAPSNFIVSRLFRVDVKGLEEETSRRSFAC